MIWNYGLTLSVIPKSTYLRGKFLKGFLAILLLMGTYSTALAHAVQVAYVVLPNGFIRVYIEHWHGNQTIESLAHNGMSVTTTVGTESITQQLNPNGAVNDTQWDNLPGAGSNIVILKRGPSANLYQDWAYYDFPPAMCNVPLIITLNGGVSVVLSQETNQFWPLTISGTFSDTAPPSITPPTPPTATVLCGVSGSVVNFSATAFDNCTSNPAIVYSKNPGSFFPIGTTMVTASSTDDNGNRSQVSFPVTVSTNDLTPPVLNLPAIIVSNNDAGLCGAKVTYNTLATDNCSSVSITQLSGLPSGAIFPVGITTNTFKATDASGNWAEASFEIIVKDAEAPQVSALASISGSCSVNIVKAPTATDKCEGPIIGKTTDKLVFTEQGTFTINWTFADSKGNTSTAIQKIIVKDTESPILPTLPNIVGVCSATAPVAVATDRCRGTIEGSTTDPLTYSSPGVHIINWKFDDGQGNISTAKQYVILKDTTVPKVETRDVVLHLNDNGTATLTEDQINNGSSDNCKITAYWLDKKYFDTSNIGMNTVTFGVTDANGNYASKTATVTVLNKSSALSSYPNPFSDQATVSLTLMTDEENINLDLYDSNGAKVKRIYAGALKANKNSFFSLDGSDLKGGIYFLRLTTSKELVNFKVVVSK
ncbi:MAG: HYR domain-containing protein [Pyrinomonadaceae bacterium]|nr:HYR domain-containing protein [Sphingobacteriaceae bacterium]